MQGVRRLDAYLAEVLESFPPDEPIELAFFSFLMLRERARKEEAGEANAAIDMVDQQESLHTAMELMREDQEILRAFNTRLCLSVGHQFSDAARAS